MNDLVDKLFNTGDLSDEELKTLLESDSFNEPLAHAADIRRRENLNGHRPSAHAIMDAAYTSAD